jgi:hypothetical protein
MMRLAMRPQKHQAQLPAYFKFENSGDFDRTKPSMFGFTDYEALLIGGAGGRSGSADGRTISGTTSYVKSSGGGGGGLIHVKGKLVDLSILSPAVVGAAGGNGADSGNGVKASNGSNGGNSSFAGFSAFGGKGGKGGKYDITADGVATCTGGQGGDGGLNSAGYGTVGVGALTSTANGSFGGSQIATDGTAPTQGVVATGSGDVIEGGGGGAGGAGRVRLFDQNQEVASDGSTGNTGPGNYDGFGTPASSGLGGTGGGANAVDWLGFPLNYGVAEALAFAGGVVFIRVT